MSYGFTEQRELNKNLILSNISQEKIFEIVFGDLPDEYQYVVSPLREDNTPKCYFEWYGDILHFIDWGSKRIHSDCFNVIQDKYNLSFYQALQYINSFYNLGLGGETTSPQKTRTVREPKKRKPIEFKLRQFNSGPDKQYWFDRYGITMNDLREDNVFPVIWYKVYSKKLNGYVLIRPDTPSYLIYHKGEYTKIYTPLNKNVRGKFCSSATQDCIGGVDNLPYLYEHLVLSKSYKDYRVLKNLGVNAVWLQNEGMLPSEQTIKSMIAGTGIRKVTIFFDNDNAGEEASIKMKDFLVSILDEEIIVDIVSLPKDWGSKGVSDPADCYHKMGKNIIENFINNLNLKEK